MPKELPSGGVDRAIGRIAGAQHGLITTRQLLDVGLLPSGISDRVSAGRMQRVHRSVYAVGHAALGNEGRWLAAVLACGADAVLSHVSAAELWRVLPPQGRPGEEPRAVHVTVPGEGKPRTGIHLHRSTTLSPADVTRRAGIPVTKPARTLADLRRTVSTQVFTSALRQAEYLRLPIGGSVKSDHTRSELETEFLKLLRRHRLPQPEVNVRVDRFVVDFLWRAERLVAEVDGWGAHRGHSAFEADRARDNRLRVLGFKVVRFTWQQVAGESKLVASTIRSLLSALW
jgi:very-short-patch-repair endonuclease